MSENVGSIVYEIDANTSGLVAAQNKVDAVNKSMQKGFAQTDKAAAGMQKGMDGVAKSTKPLAKGFDGATMGGKKFGNQMRQASMQLSQVAQQGSVTGNYLQALMIQLPDLALGFGTVGIIAGALAGTVGIGLLNAFTGAGDSVETFDETISRLGSTFETVAGESNELAKKIQEIAKISKEAVKLKLEVDAIEARKGLLVARDQLKEVFGSDITDSLNQTSREISESLGVSAEEGRKIAMAIGDIGRNTNVAENIDLVSKSVNDVLLGTEKSNKNIRNYNKILGIAKDVRDKTQEAAQAYGVLKTLQNATKDTEDTVSSGTVGDSVPSSFEDKEGDHMAAVIAARQKEAAAVIEQTRKQFQDEQTLADEQLEMRLTAIDDAQISIAEKEQAEVEARALHAQKLADLDAKRTTDEQAEAAKRLTLKKMELAAYTQLGGQLTNLVAAAGAENTAIGKAVFLANQALAVAGIIVNTQAAAAATLPLDPTGSLSTRVTTLGYTSAAIAAGVGIGQTFSGRQTGGPTEAGTPYRVGESGPELFTSGGRQFLIGGEKGNVTPNNQLGGGMSAPQVNVVVNNNTSSNVSVSQEQDGNNVTIQMLVADFAEGGPVSRAMSSSYNTKRKTT